MGTKCALLIILAGSALAQTPAISLRIETASGRTQFRMGETISVKLIFDNSSTETWTLPGLTGVDRSPLGLGSDRFLVSPEQGTSDPLVYRLGDGFTGSFLSGVFPGGKSISTNADLNQWVRFDRAGPYRVSASLHARVGKEAVTLTSNDIAIEIVPADKAWSAEQLRQAVAVLDGAAGTDQQAFDARASAARTIWYLDTPESVREAARLVGALDQQTAQPLQKALLGSAHQDAAIAAMKQLLRLADQPVTPLFIQTLASMESRQKVPLANDLKSSEAAVRRRSETSAATETQLRTELGSVVEQKRDNAKAISLKTLLDGTRPEEVPANLRAEVAGLFADLPWQQQNELLTSQWKRIAGPAMIPALLQIYENAPALPGLRQSLAPIAVRRLYELDPARARTLILDEIKLERPRLPYETLAMLPDATLPDLDPVLLDRLQRNSRPQELIARYATANIIEGVKTWYAEQDAIGRARKASNVPDVRSPACEPALIAYYLRVDPAWGEQVLRQTLGERSFPNGRCWLNVIGNTATYYVSPEWERVAIEALADPTTVEVRSDAVKALGDHGSAAAQQAVMNAFRVWHDWWKDRPAEMVSERPYEQRFLNATAHGKNWIANGETLEKIRDYCISPGCRGETDGYLRLWTDTLKVYLSESDAGDVSVGFGQYTERTLDAARVRLLQVPSGTRLKWNINARHSPEIDAWVSAIESDLAGRGVVITP